MGGAGEAWAFASGEDLGDKSLPRLMQIMKIIKTATLVPGVLGSVPGIIISLS